MMVRRNTRLFALCLLGWLLWKGTPAQASDTVAPEISAQCKMAIKATAAIFLDEFKNLGSLPNETSLLSPAIADQGAAFLDLIFARMGREGYSPQMYRLLTMTSLTVWQDQIAVGFSADSLKEFCNFFESRGIASSPLRMLGDEFGLDGYQSPAGMGNQQEGLKVLADNLKVIYRSEINYWQQWLVDFGQEQWSNLRRCSCSLSERDEPDTDDEDTNEPSSLAPLSEWFRRVSEDLSRCGEDIPGDFGFAADMKRAQIDWGFQFTPTCDAYAQVRQEFEGDLSARFGIQWQEGDAKSGYKVNLEVRTQEGEDAQLVFRLNIRG